MIQFKKNIFSAVLFLICLILILGMYLMLEAAVRYRFKMPPFRSHHPVEWLNQEEKTLHFLHKPVHRRILGRKSSKDLLRPDIQRIVFLGDSTFFRLRDESGNLFHKTIQENLNSEFNSLNVRSVMLAMHGYTVYQNSEMFRIYGADFKPDVVVLGVCLNDLHDRYLHSHDPDGGPLAIHPDGFLSRFDTKSGLGRLFSGSYAAHYVFGLIAKKDPYLFNRAISYHLAWKDYGWRNFEKRLKDLNQMVTESGAVLMVVALPLSEQYGQSESELNYILKPQKKLAEIALSNGILFLDAYDDFRKAGGSLLFSDYLHFNRSGGSVLADSISRLIAGAYESGIIFQKVNSGG